MNSSTTRVLIIGGTSGIGLATARALLDSGHSVIIASRSTAKLEAARAALLHSGRLSVHPCDISKEQDVQTLFAGVGSLDHVVVTAADPAYGPIRDMELSHAQKMLGSKLIGPLLVAKHGAAHLRSGGSITFTSGIASERPMAGGALTALVNGGIEAFVRGLALELAPLRVNAVSPGWVNTPIWTELTGSREKADSILAGMRDRLPVKRIAEPEDIADGILFLLRNRSVTGRVLHIDGGHALV